MKRLRNLPARLPLSLSVSLAVPPEQRRLVALGLVVLGIVVLLAVFALTLGRTPTATRNATRAHATAESGEPVLEKSHKGTVVHRVKTLKIRPGGS